MEGQHIVENIIKDDLKIEYSVKSIESLFENSRLRDRTDYKPYYQRNYVWDKQKASYFIESIFMGTEIPPLVFFNDGRLTEVIDGRQRYETIRKFIDMDFALVKGGLSSLPFLIKKNFNDLSPELREVFRTTKLRIIEFSIVNITDPDDHDVDLVKKEIFRRYNSGITPLRRTEMEKAIYIDDVITSSFKERFESDYKFYRDTIHILFGKRDIERIDDIHTIERVLSKVRQLLVISKIPIKRLSSKGQSLVGQFYSSLMKDSVEQEDLIENFEDNVRFLLLVRDALPPDFLEKQNSYLMFETIYWAIEVIKIEIGFTSTVELDLNFDEFTAYLTSEEVHFSADNPMFYRTMNERYQFVAKYFRERYGLNYDIYIEPLPAGVLLRTDPAIEKTSSDVEKLNARRISKLESANETIEDICKKIKREKFLIRPAYQRREVINKKKSSSLIESILLGIKIPPIFVFKRNDGVSEVVDGQQRLLSIIGFIGEEFMDENAALVKSKKHLFKLSGLKVHYELNAKSYSNLEQKLKDMILDFNIPIVTIDQNLNESFDPVDLFIRLNNKPYPIREDSFEMWNSYIDRNFIKRIKENVSKHSGWFYLRAPENNYRMDNEQCYTQLVFLFYKASTSQGADYIKFYKRNNSISSRMTDKSELTRTLEAISIDEKIEQSFYLNIKKVEKFISLVKRIISSGNDSSPDDYLRHQFGELMNLKSNRRTMQGFYFLWYILKEAEEHPEGSVLDDVKNRIAHIVSLTKNLSDEGNDIELNRFKEEIRALQRDL